MAKCVYAGSFDPFTNGHLDILRQANELFDTVYLVFAENDKKERTYDLSDMFRAVNSVIEENKLKNVVITAIDGLVSDFAYEHNATYLIRGLRNPNDYTYEENIAKINKELNNELNTVYLRADNEIISSSMVKEMYKYGKPVSKYVNHNILEVMNNGKH